MRSSTSVPWAPGADLPALLPLLLRGDLDLFDLAIECFFKSALLLAGQPCSRKPERAKTAKNGHFYGFGSVAIERAAAIVREIQTRLPVGNAGARRSEDQGKH